MSTSPAQAINSENKKILFIHHSTGGNLIPEGHVRDQLKALNPSIQFFDHSYNLPRFFPQLIARLSHYRGLTNSTGEITGQDYNIILSNNSPKEYAEIFSRDPQDPTLKAILSYDLIAFKNCFPTTKIESDAQLNEDMKYYVIIRDALKRFPAKKFVLVTPPPMRKSGSSIENANRAKKLVSWLNSADFLQGTSNLQVFDFFGLLADSDGFLKKEYTRFLPWDSHPNRKANQDIAPVFARFLAGML